MREVFAEEIEEFLKRLEGIASARVVANEDGQIDRVFLTTESERDDGALRRQASAALMSRYGLHLEGWRLQIAHLRPEPGRPGPAHVRVFRIEETLTEDATRVLVELRYERDGATKSAIGVARASAGAAFRLRTVAQAALEAMRTAVEEAGWKAALESVTVVPFAGAQVALVAVTAAGPRGAPDAAPVQVGSEPVHLSEPEAVVRATLRALAQVIEEEVPARARDRRSQLEAMRAHYRRLIRVPREPEPRMPPDGETGEGPAGDADGSHPDGGIVEAEPVAEPEVAVEPEAPGDMAPPPDHSADPAAAAASPDTIAGVEEIRPEIEGGAAMSTREEPYRAEGNRPTPRGSQEDDFYRRLIQSGVTVHIRCRDGYEIPEAVVRDFGTYSLLVEAGGAEELVFKHAIISIRPRVPLARDTAVQA
ncbi:MAG: RNA chaperone Hfq [Armatimonadetes bacterium]|nr:RNA chaperone Hfq [Armatimonadota bacterium]